MSTMQTQGRNRRNPSITNARNAVPTQLLSFTNLAKSGSNPSTPASQLYIRQGITKTGISRAAVLLQLLGSHWGEIATYGVNEGLTMWHMEAGDRAMTRAEWGVFQLGLAELVAHLEEDLDDETDETRTGVAVFDRLTIEQKIALLADVAAAMRHLDEPMLDLTAASEGAVQAVFVVARALLKEEIADNSHMTMRSLLVEVAKEHEFERGDVPRLKSRKFNDWDFLLECLESSIFWDCDWEAGDHFLDAPPDEAKARMECLGIDPEYFLSIPREPNPKELRSARRKLSRLIGDEL